MKKFLISVSIGIAVAFASAPAQAQLSPGKNYGTIPTFLNGGTNNIAAASTNNYYSNSLASFSCGDFDYVGIQISFSADAATTGLLTLRLQESDDSATGYESTPKWVFTPKANGTNTVVWNTNIFVPTGGTLRLYTGENTNATANYTNIIFKPSFKAHRIQVPR
ncbi:MAG TPA: hypothetical protein VFC07_00065 [Verrucomicrobiae bacterium]|nr:hypothetical protein [Verrucomicrobiae bacterium]